MNQVKRITLILVALNCCIETLTAQTSVYENNCIQPTPVQFSDLPPVFGAGCVEMPNPNGGFQFYEIEGDKELRAKEYIEWSPGMEITPANQGDGLLAHIFDFGMEVVTYHPNMDAIGRYEKLELGIKPAQEVLDAIQSFIDESPDPQLNPFMSDDIRVQAVFDYIPPTHTNPAFSVVRDGFYTRDFERDVSGFDALYDHEYLDGNGVYWDTYGTYPAHPDTIKYVDLGGGWTPLNTEYPFRIRFAPSHVGTWWCKIIISSTLGYWESPSFKFTVVPSSKHGYLEVDKNKRFLKRDGESFRPVGLNNPWPIRDGWPLQPYRDNNDQIIVNGPQHYSVTAPIALYEQYLRRMDTLAMNGMNYFRMIMNPWSLDIEFEKLGNYYDRLHIASEMDLIVERAEQNDMMIHWNFMLHDVFQTLSFAIRFWDWDTTYNDGEGTNYCYPRELNLPNRISFFTDPTAKKFYKERLRYLVARYGYSPTIAMFEHFSEIDQIGKIHEFDADNELITVVGSEYLEGSEFMNYEDSLDNRNIISLWHEEMSNYLKDELYIPQLITVSYTAKGFKIDDDNTFWHGNIDVINKNNYNFFPQDGTGVHDYFRHKGVYSTLTTNDGGSENWGSFKKPVFYSEMGPHEVWKCDKGMEIRRSIWQSYFLGISGGLEWDEIGDLSVYKRVNEFVSGVDLEGGNWHPGIFKRKKNGNNKGRWDFKSNFAKNCVREDELADVVYMRSKDDKKAFGVISNRRWNYYTLGEGECTDGTKLRPIHSDSIPQYNLALQSLGSVSPDGGSNRLRIRDMPAGEYKIKYYSPYDQVNSLKEETRWGPQLTLEFPEMDTLGIILFEVFRTNTNFKNMEQDTTEDNTQVVNREEELQEDILIYPNPNNGDFVIQLNNPSLVKEIRIVDNLGKPIHSLKNIERENQFNLIHLPSGTYTVEVLYHNETILKKIIIN